MRPRASPARGWWSWKTHYRHRGYLRRNRNDLGEFEQRHTFTAPITDLGEYLEVSDATLDITTNQSFTFTDLDIGEGTFRGGGGNLTITGSMVWNGEAVISGFGTLTIASGAVLHLSTGYYLGTETLNGVMLDNAGMATLVGAVGSDNGLALENGAEFVNEPGGIFTILTSGPITSDGTATAFVNQGSLIQPATAIGQTIIEPAFTQTTTGTTVVIVSNLTLDGSGSSATNAGSVTVESGGTLSVSTDYDQSAGSTTLIQGVFSGVNLNVDGGTLSGIGVVNANVTNSGQVIPGGTGAAGLLTIDGNYVQSAAGSLDVELGGTMAGSQYDQIAVSGTASLGGLVNVALISTFAPTLNNAFQILTFASSSGNFGFYNGIVLGYRLFLDPTLNPTNLTLTVQPAVTTTTLSTPASPSVSGQGVTLTATVTMALPPTTIDPSATGTVTFYDNGQSIGTGSLNFVNDQEQSTFTTSTLSTASHAITAAYTSGDANFIPSPVSTAVTQLVNKANTSTMVTTSGSPSVYGQAVTLTATVSVASPGSTAVASPTGNVTFHDNGQSIGTGTLSIVNGHDQATLTTAALGTSGHSITAAYTSGDGNFNASAVSTAVTQVVNKDSTTTTAGASPGFANVGQAVTFTATVTANAPGSGTPTGTVDFYDTTTSTDLTPGGIALSSATAAFTTTSLAVGSHTIKATYSGDTNFITSSASTNSVTIGQSIIVLDPSAGGALSLSGNASIKLTGGVYVDSSSSTALSASGNAAIKASVIDVHGGVQKSGNASFSPTPTTGAAVLADPLASLAEPSISGLTNYGSESLSGNSSATIKPGIYSQITVSGNGTLTMDSGIYIIEGGGFTVSGNAGVTGSGVMIVNAGSKYPTTGGTYGSITLSGSGSYNLSPPTTGTYAGIVIFQTRDNSKALTLSGNASGMTGTVYASAAQLAESGNASLNAALIVDTLTINGNGINNTVTLSSPSGTVAYSPAQIRSAYGISSLPEDGTGQTIAIVDAYDDPAIFQALDAFDSQFGLTSSGPTLYSQYGPASSFLTVLNQYGQATSLPSTDPNGPGTDNWEVEEALDVEWAHAIAPGAQIILVEANSQSLSDLMASVATAASQSGVSVVSMSWGFAEGQAVFSSDEATYDSVFNTPGVTFVASTGDYGAADPEYPAYSPNVVAVGGTSLIVNTDNSYNSETGWGYYSDSVGAYIASGGGISLYEPQPAYQQGVQSTGYRTTPDVSLVADPATGAWIADPYNLDPSNPFEIVGGTSLSAPAWAGLVTLANQGRAAVGESTLNSLSPTDTQQALYMLPQIDYNAIASGNNGYSAGAGYNLVTGLGTPVANLLVPDLIAYKGPSTSYSGPTVAPLQNAGLVNTGASNGGPIDVFSVFDALTVTGNGFGDAQGQGATFALSNATTAPEFVGRMPVSPQTTVGLTVGAVSTSAPLGVMPLPLAGTVFTPISTGLMSPRPASSATQAIVKGPAISEPVVAIQRASAGVGVALNSTRLRGNLVRDSVLNELVSDAVILQSHQGAQTFEAPAFPRITANNDRDGGDPTAYAVGSRSVQPSDTSNARLAMILLAAGFSCHRPSRSTPARGRRSGFKARRQPGNAGT